MKIFTTAFLLVLALFNLTACLSDDSMEPKEPKEPAATGSDSVGINSWIYEQMSMYYLWNTSLPFYPDKNQDPSSFFESLRNKSDRFSWIRENYVDLLSSLSGVSSGDIGFEHIGFLDPLNPDLIVAQVVYVKPLTPAQAVGVKRGDVFTKVDGVRLNKLNWLSILSKANSSAQITFVNATLGNPVNKTIAKVTKYSENPVYLDSIYRIDNKRIGYLVYNFFATDNGDESMSYSLLLNQVFSRFKAGNITDLVLDLRYNLGGSVLSSTTLASMIVPNLNTSSVFSKLTFNSFLQADYIRRYGSDVLLDKFMDQIKIDKKTDVPINNVGNLTTLYVLTSGWTASASEMIINGLRPYMNVYLIGAKTVGKNVGSFSLYEKNNPNNKWGLQPIVLKYFNANGFSDFEEGFDPDIVLLDNNLQKLALGDVREDLLQAALLKITGKEATRSPKFSRGQTLLPVGASLEGKAWSNQCIVDNRPIIRLDNKDFSKD